MLWPAFTALGYPLVASSSFYWSQASGVARSAGMKWTEINGDAWLLPGARAKSKQGHRIPLSSLALEILESTPRIGEYVFMARRGRL